VDHRSIAQFSQIPASYIQAASGLRLLFRHASVGNNLSQALDCLGNNFASSRPNFCDRGLSSDQVVFDSRYNRNNWTFEFHAPPPGINPGWWDKELFFINRVDNPQPGESFNVVGFKFGYVDGFSGSNIAPRFFDRAPNDRLPGVENMEALEVRHPGKRVMYWTMGLPRAATVEMQSFNQQMRAYATANQKVFFDIAAIQSHRPDGSACFDNAGRGIEAICDEYTDEVNAGHLNALGRLQVAKGFWVLMARLAGWSQ
jgi:hypothetical protein